MGSLGHSPSIIQLQAFPAIEHTAERLSHTLPLPKQPPCPSLPAAMLAMWPLSTPRSTPMPRCACGMCCTRRSGGGGWVGIQTAEAWLAAGLRHGTRPCCNCHSLPAGWPWAMSVACSCLPCLNFSLPVSIRPAVVPGPPVPWRACWAARCGCTAVLLTGGARPPPCPSASSPACCAATWAGGWSSTVGRMQEPVFPPAVGREAAAAGKTATSRAPGISGHLPAGMAPACVSEELLECAPATPCLPPCSKMLIACEVTVELYMGLAASPQMQVRQHLARAGGVPPGAQTSPQIQATAGASEGRWGLSCAHVWPGRRALLPVPACLLRGFSLPACLLSAMADVR